jgi:hypothetical protein
MDIGNGTQVDYLSHHPRVEGLSLIITTDTRREVMTEKVYNCSLTVLIAWW